VQGFDYFRKAGEGYRPLSSRAALKAVEEGLLPPEAFLFLGTSAKPLDDEPLDLGDIERILAREDLDLQTNRLLLRLFQKLLASQDPELALFAAESVNLIENRYNSRIAALRRELEQEGSPPVEQALPALRELARLLYELAQLTPLALGRFYLREAYTALQRLNRSGGLRKQDGELLVRVLLALRLYDQAAGILRQLRRRLRRLDPALLLLEAEVQFYRRDFLRVRQLLQELRDPKAAPADEVGSRLVDYWLEQPG